MTKKAVEDLLVADGNNYISQNYIGISDEERIDGGGATNQHDTSTFKLIFWHLFHPDNKISWEMAIDYNHHCKLGIKKGVRPNNPGEELLKRMIGKVRDLYEGDLKAMVQDVIKRECSARQICYQGNPITKMDQIAKAWAENMTLQEDLWHCCYGTFAKGIDWESEYEIKAMEKLKYKSLEDDQAQQVGTNQRGKKGCIAKLATKVKRDIMKNINRKAAKTHGTILGSGSAPVILGEYESGKTKYQKRKDNAGFNFNETLHTKVCCKIVYLC
jgi:hypothetical protein